MAYSLDSRPPVLCSRLLAAMLGYIGYSGDVLRLLGDGRDSQAAPGAGRRGPGHDSPRLEAAIDSAKRELARGSVEDLRKRVEAYRATLAVLRQLVPEQNEVPNLLDDISTRAKIRGVPVAGRAAAGRGRPGAVRHPQLRDVGDRPLRPDRRVPDRRRGPPADHRARSRSARRRPSRPRPRRWVTPPGRCSRPSSRSAPSSSRSGEASGANELPSRLPPRLRRFRRSPLAGRWRRRSAGTAAAARRTAPWTRRRAVPPPPRRHARGRAPHDRRPTDPAASGTRDRARPSGTRGGARDPFESLLDGGERGSGARRISRWSAIYIDHRDADDSVAVLREQVTGKRYKLRVGRPARPAAGRRHPGARRGLHHR